MFNIIIKLRINGIFFCFYKMVFLHFFCFKIIIAYYKKNDRHYTNSMIKKTIF